MAQVKVVVGSSIYNKVFAASGIQGSVLECCPDYLEPSLAKVYSVNAGALKASFTADFIVVSATIAYIAIASIEVH